MLLTSCIERNTQTVGSEVGERLTGGRKVYETTEREQRK